MQLGTHSLKRDDAYVEKHLDELARAAENEGKTVVLIHHRRPEGFFDSEIEAVKTGFRRFGRDPFIVRVVRGPELRRVVASNFAP